MCLILTGSLILNTSRKQSDLWDLPSETSAGHLAAAWREIEMLGGAEIVSHSNDRKPFDGSLVMAVNFPSSLHPTSVISFEIRDYGSAASPFQPFSAAFPAAFGHEPQLSDGAS